MDETQSQSENEGTKQPTQGSNDFSESDVNKIDRYTILGILGKGGFGRVYLAHDDDLDRPVAIKVPNPARISHPEDEGNPAWAGGAEAGGKILALERQTREPPFTIRP